MKMDNSYNLKSGSMALQGGTDRIVRSADESPAMEMDYLV
jgi:hypothetical protein